MFGHEQFKAYHLAIEFVAQISQLLLSIPTGFCSLAEQLRRAAISIPLNIAEGTGKTSPRDKKRFYAIARGSTFECAAILDVLLALRALDKSTVEKPKSLLHSIAAILSAVILKKEQV